MKPTMSSSSKRACADKTGTMDFFIGFHHHSSSLDAEWARGEMDAAERVTVPATTLDDFFLQEKRAAPDLIKIDIEGGGTAALPGAKKCFAEKRPVVLI